LLTNFGSRDNLYNTNEKFDYGGFRTLEEAQTQQSTTATLFAYQFKDPGVYAFYLSTNVDRTMVRDLNPIHSMYA
jgi:hypothetical protein